MARNNSESVGDVVLFGLVGVSFNAHGREGGARKDLSGEYKIVGVLDLSIVDGATLDVNNARLRVGGVNEILNIEREDGCGGLCDLHVDFIGSTENVYFRAVSAAGDSGVVGELSLKEVLGEL